MGYEDALSGSAGRARMAQGQSCEKEYSPSSFEKDYMSGFIRGREESCQEGKAGELAVRDAAEGAEMKSLKIFAVCTEGRVLKDALERKYKKAFAAEFCSPERAQKLGTTHGGEFREKDFSTFEKICDDKSKVKLKGAYTTEYNRVLQEKCSPVEIQALALKDARANADMAQSLSKLKICPAAEQTAIVGAYSRTFNDTKLLMMKEQEMKEAKEAQERERALREREIKLRETQLTEQRAAQGGGIVLSVNGQDLLAQCEIRAQRVVVLVKNLSDRYVALSGSFEVDVFDYRGEFLTREKQSVYRTVSSRSTETFEFPVVALGQPSRCSPKFHPGR